MEILEYFYTTNKVLTAAIISLLCVSTTLIGCALTEQKTNPFTQVTKLAQSLETLYQELSDIEEQLNELSLNPQTETADSDALFVLKQRQEEIKREIAKEEEKLNVEKATTKPSDQVVQENVVPDANLVAVNTMLKGSKRVKSLFVKEGAVPGIFITKCEYGKTMTFKSKEHNEGKVSQGQEYLILCYGGPGDQDEAAASHGVRDERVWTKTKNRTTKLMVVLVENNRSKLIDFSDVYDVK